MTAPRAALAALALAVASSAAPRTAGGDADLAPRLRSFAPAAVHTGAEFLFDAEFDGARPPRVWVGAYRVAPSRLRVAPSDAGASLRRVWGRVPSRVPAGEQILKIATRRGTAFAAKPIHVVSCNAAPPGPGDCGDIPDAGVDLNVTGAKNYKDRIQLAQSAEGFEFEPGTTSVSACRDAGDFHCFGITLPFAMADLHVGPVVATAVSYYDGNAHNWRSEPGGTVQIVEESPTRVGICIDVEIPSGGGGSSSLPATVKVKGYLVIAR